MRVIFNYTLLFLIVAAPLDAKKPSLNNGEHEIAEEACMFAKKWEMSKGGIGIVNNNLYVVVKSAAGESNELIVKPTAETEARWHGKSVTNPEVVIVYKGKVWSSNDKLPDGFDLTNSSVISFESDKVRFIDFQAKTSGYFERIKIKN